MKLILSIPLITGAISLCLSPILFFIYWLVIKCEEHDRSGRDIINRKKHDGFSNC